ncbi:hypothetical protein RRG08_048864, partial [Elysia crispata]
LSELQSRDWGNLEPCVMGLDPPGACYPGSGSVDQFVLVQTDLGSKRDLLKFSIGHR